MNKNIFSKIAFFISVVVALSLLSFALVFAAILNAPANTLPVYPMGAVDSNEEACKEVAGPAGLIDDSTNKCCGGNKLRSSGDPLCQAKSLCDGTTWHNAADPNELGEVFRIPASAGLKNMQYPIVNINGGLVMCVDDSKYKAFRDERAVLDAGSAIGCLPDLPGKNTGTSFGAQEMDYLCPPENYYAGGNMVPGAGNVCRADHIVNEAGNLKSGKGFLFCNGWYDNRENDDLSGMWGHAYLISDAGRGLPFEDDNSPTSERCPSQIGGPWLDSGGNPFAETTVIPCPGMVEVANIPDRSYVGPFGSADDRVAGVCLPKQTNKPVYDIFFNNLNYVKARLNVDAAGKVNVLGKVRGKEYLCDTLNRAVAPAPGTSNAQVYICCGALSDADCKKDIPGFNKDGVTKIDPYANFKLAGGFISFNETNSAGVMTSNFKLFCRTDGTWGLDLDNDAKACVTASDWSGKYCCSEGGDDSALRSGTKYFESFADAGGKGVCIKSSYKPNLVGFDANRFIVSDGLLMSCSGDMWRTNNDGLSLKLGNTKVSSPLSVPGTSSDSAFADEFDKSLAVWNGAASGVYGQFMKSDGTLTGSVLTISSSAANSVRVAYSSADKKFLVVIGDSSGLQGKFIKEDGAVTSTFQIISGACYLGSGDSYGSIAYSSVVNKFVVSCTKGSPTSGEIVVATINPDATLHGPPLSLGTGSKSSVSMSDSQALVTWSSADTKFLRIVQLSTPPQLAPIQSIPGAGWMISYYDYSNQRFEIVYGANNAISRRQLSASNSLSQEVKVNVAINISVIDAMHSPLKNSVFFVFPSENFVGGLSIAELSSKNVLSRPFDVAIANYSGTFKSPVLSTNPSISDFNGVPLTLMSRQSILFAQPGGLSSMEIPNWPNPGSTTSAKINGSLATSFDSCTKFSETNQNFCDIDGTWRIASTDKSHFSFVPSDLMNHFKSMKANLSENMKCCAANQCFDPVKNNCINPQLAANDYYNLSNGKVYKCINGVWGNPEGGYKFTADACKKGFCNAPGQCLHNPAGSVLQNGNVSGNPQCINSGQFIGDALCLNSSWSSRTVLATNTLLKFTKNADGSIKNYVLVCSNSSKDVLVNAQSPGNSKNAYCILDLLPGTANNQRIIAVALSQDLEVPIGDPGFGSDYIFAIKKSFIMSYPLAKFNSTCTIVDGYTQACAEGKSKDDSSLLKLYYNSTSKIVVFSDKQIAGLTPTWQESVCAWLPSWLSWLCPSPQAQTSSFTNLTFDRIYSSKLGNIEVLGISKNRCEVVGTTKIQSYVFDYKGYSVGDVQNVIGTSDLYAASEFLITPGADSASSKVIIKNPSDVDKNALWNALASVRK